MEASEHVVRIRRIDSKKEDDFVLLHVSCTTRNPINFRLLATEGEQAYVTTITSTQIREARDAKNPQTPSQWTDTLLSLLTQRASSPSPSSSGSPSTDSEVIELVASLSTSPPTVNLLIRKNISGIIQRLGSLTLPQDDDEELDTLHWTSVAIERANVLDREVAALTSRSKSAEQTIASLTKQLEELIVAKQAHETALLGKCAELLNQKKAKIREQQRLLAGMTGEQRRGERGRDGESRGARTAKAAEVRRRDEALPVGKNKNKKKRKAGDAALREGGGDDDDEGDEEEAFEGPSSARTIKVEDADDDEDMDDRTETPEVEEEDDITEDEDADPHDGTEPGENDTHGEDAHLNASPSGTKDLPPDRELPFDKAVTRPAVSAQREAAIEGEETDDDDDDEL